MLLPETEKRMTNLRTRSAAWEPVPGNPGLRFRYYVATDIGAVRATNEDNFIVQPEMGLFAVADGMGGHAGGEVASLLTSEQMRKVIGALEGEAASTADPTIEVTSAGISEATLRAQEAELILNVGDSRAYRYADKALMQLTEDHTTEGQVEVGGVTRMRRYLTRTVGGSKGTASPPDCFYLRCYPHDRFLLCTDGIWGKLLDEQLIGCLRMPDPKDACAQLIKGAIRAGSTDNLTALIVDLMATPEERSEEEGSGESVDPTILSMGE
ncbi:MAG: serine/threonine-protein phosphatase [Deltaproteobacteria bacterium]|nr:serine/threonine-protein phosphatase [Deltaproteobacteria bacterium]